MAYVANLGAVSTDPSSYYSTTDQLKKSIINRIRLKLADLAAAPLPKNQTFRARTKKDYTVQAYPTTKAPIAQSWADKGGGIHAVNSALDYGEERWYPWGDGNWVGSEAFDRQANQAQLAELFTGDKAKGRINAAVNCVVDRFVASWDGASDINIETLAQEATNIVLSLTKSQEPLGVLLPGVVSKETKDAIGGCSKHLPMAF